MDGSSGLEAFIDEPIFWGEFARIRLFGMRSRFGTVGRLIV